MKTIKDPIERVNKNQNINQNKIKGGLLKKIIRLTLKIRWLIKMNRRKVIEPIRATLIHMKLRIMIKLKRMMINFE